MMSKWTKIGVLVAASLVALTAPGAARATTTASLPTTGFTKAYANASWVSASSSLGTFGAGVRYNTALSTDAAGGARSIDSKADLDLQLFGLTFPFAGVEGNLMASSAADTAPSERIGATVAGFTLLSQVVTSAQSNSAAVGVSLGETKMAGFKLGAAITGSYSFDGFSICLEASATKDTALGPIPITITGALDACPNMGVQAATASQTTAGKSLLNYDMRPSINTSFTLSAGVGSSDYGSLGLWGSVDIIDYGTSLTTSLSVDPNAASVDYNVLGSETLRSLSGSFGAYVSVGYKALSATYQRTLVSWEGISWHNQIVLTDSVPTASSVTVDFGVTEASGSYTFNDTNGAADVGTTYQWYRAISADGANPSAVAGETGTRFAYRPNNDGRRYLRFCAKPRNSGGNWGVEACSDWMFTGGTLSLYRDADFVSESRTYAYEMGGHTSQCVNTTGFNDIASAFNVRTPLDASITLWLFRDADCGGSRVPINVPAATNYKESWIGNLGSGWNDSVSSFLVVWDETATADNLNVDISGNTATAQYSFSDSADMPESGSSYRWFRADSGTGVGAVTIDGATGRTYTLARADEGSFLRVCVTPSTGFLTSAEVCSDWSAGVGDYLRLYQDTNLSGNAVYLAYEHGASGACYNLPDHGFNDKLSSWYVADMWTAKQGATLVFYRDANCAGATTSTTVPPGWDGYSVNSMPSGWNDQASSVAVFWTPTVTISTPTVTIAGNKATSSYAYSDTTGRADQSSYDWYYADDANGTNSTPITSAWSKDYTLTGVENNKYLRLCVNPSNGVTIGTRRCSGWASVGYEIRFFSQQSLTSSTATSLNFAYQRSPTDKCFNMQDYGFDDVARAFDLLDSSGGHAQVTLFQAADCVSSTTPAVGVEVFGDRCWMDWTPSGGMIHGRISEVWSTNLGTQLDNTVSSFRVQYR